MQIPVQTENGRARLRLDGRFDFSVHREFRDAYMPLLEDNSVREIVIDLMRVEYVDSSALGMLLLLRERAQTSGKQVVLSGARGTVRQVLEVANFGRMFTIEG
jgi:anti-anti-sigma factor